MKSGIYQILNKVNGKSYVGSAVNIKRRWAYHRSSLRRNVHENPILQYSWNKYGQYAFKFSILEYVSNVELLVEIEQYYIDWLDTLDRKYGYNINHIAGSRLGIKHTEESKNKMSKRMMGNTYSKGIKHSEESKANMKASKQKFIGVPMKEEVKAKIKASNIGKKFSDETRMKMSISHKKRFSK